jgi:TolB protein
MLRHFISITFIILFQVCFQSCKTSIENPNETIPTGILSFITTRDGNFEIYSMTADGKNVKNLSNNKSLDFWSSWSP